jgi:hypothetical protein
MRFAGGQEFEGLWEGGQPVIVDNASLPAAAESPEGPAEPAAPDPAEPAEAPASE